jgi:hypothetical protein
MLPCLCTHHTGVQRALTDAQVGSFVEAVLARSDKQAHLQALLKEQVGGIIRPLSSSCIAAPVLIDIFILVTSRCHSHGMRCCRCTCPCFMLSSCHNLGPSFLTSRWCGRWPRTPACQLWSGPAYQSWRHAPPLGRLSSHGRCLRLNCRGTHRYRKLSCCDMHSKAGQHHCHC